METRTRKLLGVVVLACAVVAMLCTGGCNRQPDRKSVVVKQVAKAGGVKINAKDGAEMILIPAGEFVMGDLSWLAQRDAPNHKVYLKPYYIYKNHVTVAQYRKFCDATGRQITYQQSFTGPDNYPMVSVTWFEARDYAKWAGCDLPTEAQWEKAARGNDGRTYPWGDRWDSRKAHSGWKGVSGENAPVGSFPSGASPYGVLDMAGNAWDWCQDWYDSDYYEKSPPLDPSGPTTGTYRVLRGGAAIGVDTGPNDFRTYNRYFYAPDQDFVDIGFRCVKTP